ncbi:MAG TPA: glutaredoxin domain-containing protein [Polyangiales bacterium]|nr:glutaredoxin domain-containing protein [Polyangiales bacterium]
MNRFFVWSVLSLTLACGNPDPGSSAAKAVAERASALGEAVRPPFDVKDDADGLLLVWYDEQGDAHPANKRAEVPEANRQRVRVEALELAPDQRLDPAFVYVADLRTAAADGQYPVRKVERDALEASLVSARPVAASSDVIIYGASWCGACKQARQFFEHKGVPFVEKDIEKEPAARGEMMAKAKAQGVNTGGIPVIDVKGTLIGGFNAARIDQLLATN